MTDAGGQEPPEDSGRAWGGELWAAADLVTPMALRVPATLCLADHIVAGRRTLDALVAATGTDADALQRVLAHLVGAGVLTDEDDGYGLGPLGEQLRSDAADGVRAWIDLDGAVGRADLSLVELLHTVRTGEPGFPRQFGRSFWEDLSAEPARGASFDALMGDQQSPQAVAAAYDWGALGSVVDVGGGNATQLIAILRAHPRLRGTVLDLPGPVAAARQAIADADLGGRADTLAQSFFDALPAGAGGYVLSRVLNDWDDEPARRILARCAEAAATGTVLVVDHSDDVGASTEMDLRMLTYCRGRERSREQLCELAASAGLRVASITPAGMRSVIELRAA